jgi:hypothetical protein
MGEPFKYYSSPDIKLDIDIRLPYASNRTAELMSHFIASGPRLVQALLNIIEGEETDLKKVWDDAPKPREHKLAALPPANYEKDY